MNKEKFELNSNASIDLMKLNVKPIYLNKESIKVNTSIEFEAVKLNVLKSHYIGLYKRKNIISIATDNGYYYVIDLDNIDIKQMITLLAFRKPKKIIFNISI